MARTPGVIVVFFCGLTAQAQPFESISLPPSASKLSPAASPADQYQPSAAWHLDDLQDSVETKLGQLPGVAKVDARVLAAEPHCSIIQIKDWHFIPKELFAADFHSATDDAIDDDRIDEAYQRHLEQVDLVQHEQMQLLRCLIRHHGLRHVFCEGVSDEDLVIHSSMIRVLRRGESEWPEWQSQLRESQQRHEQLAGQSTAQSDELDDLAIFIENLQATLRAHKHQTLQVGAVGRLIIDGEKITVRPLEELAAYRRAHPVADDGRVEIRAEDNEAREDAHVQHLISSGGVALVILGGAHDLSDNIQRLAPNTCRYTTVATNAYQRFAERAGIERRAEIGQKPIE